MDYCKSVEESNKQIACSIRIKDFLIFGFLRTGGGEGEGVPGFEAMLPGFVVILPGSEGLPGLRAMLSHRIRSPGVWSIDYRDYLWSEVH